MVKNWWLTQQAFYLSIFLAFLLSSSLKVQASQEQEFFTSILHWSSAWQFSNKYHQWKRQPAPPFLLPWLLLCCRHTGLSASLHLQLILPPVGLSSSVHIPDQPCLLVSVSLLKSQSLPYILYFTSPSWPTVSVSLSYFLISFTFEMISFLLLKIFIFIIFNCGNLLSLIKNIELCV